MSDAKEPVGHFYHVIHSIRICLRTRRRFPWTTVGRLRVAFALQISDVPICATFPVTLPDRRDGESGPWCHAKTLNART
jgi:hypothetical protein